MLSNGIPVPDGFVVLSTTFDQFLHNTDLTQEIEAILSNVEHETVSSVEKASQKIQELIKHAEMPAEIANEIQTQFKKLGSQFVAVRSSATAEDGAENAWAGQLDSFLNTTEKDLLEKVQHCWASLFTPRAIFYRFEKGLNNQKISVAVVIQKMVDSEKSGIAFSVHPVTEDPNQLIIEAGFGLGEAIVSGQITPDSYVVTKNPKEIIDINISNQDRAIYRKQGGGNEWKDILDKINQQVLSEKQILELTEIILRIESHYGFPCDIEWAYENNQFYVVQSRPITTLSKKEEIPEKIKFEKEYSRDNTLLIQQAWCSAVNSYQIKLEMKEYKNKLLVFDYLNDGVVEIWENEKWTKDLLNEILKKNSESDDVFNWHLNNHKEQLAFIKPYWEKGFIDDISQLVKIVDRVFENLPSFGWVYYSGVDDRTPAYIREQALKMRDEDVYYDSTDTFFRKSLIAIYPELAEYEQGILRNEIENPPTLEILKKRKNHCIAFGENGASEETLREYQKKHPELDFDLEISFGNDSEIVGQVGNKGYAKGFVRIMKRKQQIVKAKEGDIIVSTMTTPDFVPAMKKAAAIITDEGGITCHAAIVARELKKPCIIGTKFATQVLHDGDLVEVDADNGVVRIISKNNS